MVIDVMATGIQC